MRIKLLSAGIKATVTNTEGAVVLEYKIGEVNFDCDAAGLVVAGKEITAALDAVFNSEEVQRAIAEATGATQQ